MSFTLASPHSGVINKVLIKKGARVAGNTIVSNSLRHLLCVISIIDDLHRHTYVIQICTIKCSEDSSLKEVRCIEHGNIDVLCISEGDVVKEGDELCRVTLCHHPAIQGDMCIRCGKKVVATKDLLAVNFRGCPTNITVQGNTARKTFLYLLPIALTMTFTELTQSLYITYSNRFCSKRNGEIINITQQVSISFRSRSNCKYQCLC